MAINTEQLSTTAALTEAANETSIQKSNMVALTMGAFSIAILLVLGLILSIIH